LFWLIYSHDSTLSCFPVGVSKPRACQSVQGEYSILLLRVLLNALVASVDRRTTGRCGENCQQSLSLAAIYGEVAGLLGKVQPHLFMIAKCGIVLCSSYQKWNMFSPTMATMRNRMMINEATRYILGRGVWESLSRSCSLLSTLAFFGRRSEGHCIIFSLSLDTRFPLVGISQALFWAPASQSGSHLTLLNYGLLIGWLVRALSTLSPFDCSTLASRCHHKIPYQYHYYHSLILHLSPSQEEMW
jgi:hypothetical protein